MPNSKKPILDKLTELDSNGLLKFMSTHFPYILEPVSESIMPVTQNAFTKLSIQDIVAIENSVGNKFGEEVLQNLVYWRNNNIEHYRREILRYGVDVLPELMRFKTEMSAANPPNNIPSSLRQEVFAGDLYSGDLCISALNRAEKLIRKNGHYLDFGCLSGALVRNLWAGFQDSNWHGCDSTESAIRWAEEQFPFIEFTLCTPQPQLAYENEKFHGVFSIYPWSQFSEEVALDWFSEMHRVILPKGFLVFSNRGIRSLYYSLENNLLLLEQIATLLSSFLDKQYAFQDNPKKPDGWGDSFFSSTWVANNLFSNWRLLDYQIGLNQGNQDVYVLERI